MRAVYQRGPGAPVGLPCADAPAGAISRLARSVSLLTAERYARAEASTTSVLTPLPVARRVGAPYYLHESNKDRVAFEFSPLSDGQRLESGNVLVDIIHTPGHTPDSGRTFPYFFSGPG